MKKHNIELVFVLLSWLLLGIAIMFPPWEQIINQPNQIHYDNYIHVIDNTYDKAFYYEDTVNKYWIEADTVDNQIYYRIYCKERTCNDTIYQSL